MGETREEVESPREDMGASLEENDGRDDVKGNDNGTNAHECAKENMDTEELPTLNKEMVPEGYGAGKDSGTAERKEIKMSDQDIGEIRRDRKYGREVDEETRKDEERDSRKMRNHREDRSKSRESSRYESRRKSRRRSRSRHESRDLERRKERRSRKRSKDRDRSREKDKGRSSRYSHRRSRHSRSRSQSSRDGYYRTSRRRDSRSREREKKRRSRRYSRSSSGDRDSRKHRKYRSRSNSRSSSRSSGLRYAKPAMETGVSSMPAPTISSIIGMNLPFMTNEMALNASRPNLLFGMPNMVNVPFVNPATRSSRRLYVGGIPRPCIDTQLSEFLSSTLIALGLVDTSSNAGRPPILKSHIYADRGFAFVEFYKIEDCNTCMQLDGIIYAGNPLKIGRPRDFVPPPGHTELPPLGPLAIAALLAQKTGQPLPPELAAAAANAPSTAGAATGMDTAGVGPA